MIFKLQLLTGTVTCLLDTGRIFSQIKDAWLLLIQFWFSVKVAEKKWKKRLQYTELFSVTLSHLFVRSPVMLLTTTILPEKKIIKKVIKFINYTRSKSGFDVMKLSNFNILRFKTRRPRVGPEHLYYVCLSVCVSVCHTYGQRLKKTRGVENEVRSRALVLRTTSI